MIQDTTPYYQAARFASKAKAGQVYTPLQEIIFQEDCDLSAYRIRITEGWHVIVLGEKPSDQLHQRIEALLTNGTLVNLRSDVLAYLQRRRARAEKIAPWVEVHYQHEEE